MSYTPQFSSPGAPYPQATAQTAPRAPKPTTLPPMSVYGDTFSHPTTLPPLSVYGDTQQQQLSSPGVAALPGFGAPDPQATQQQQQSNYANGLSSIYDQYLGRRPDDAGREFYNGLMQNQGYTQQQVADLIAGSAEAQDFRQFGRQTNVFDQSQDAMNQAQSRLGQTFSAPNVQARDVQARQLSETNLDPYMNPYTQAVTDTTMSELERQRLIAMNQTNSAASGAFGGSRHGVMQAETNRGFGDIAARTTAGLNSDNFMQAQGAAFQDISNTLGADSSNQSAQLQASINNAQNALQANGQNLQGATGLAQIANMGFSRGQSALDAQMNAGNMQQALQQKLIDAAKQQTMSDTGFSDEAISRLMSVLGGIPIPETQTQSSNPGLLGFLSALL